MDWYASLQTTIDMFFTYLPMITMLGGVAVIVLLIKKMMPKTRGKKGGLF